MVLQKVLEKERLELERERELAAKNSHIAQDRLREEFELAIGDWKQTLNVEIFRAKEEQMNWKRRCCGVEHMCTIT